MKFSELIKENSDKQYLTEADEALDVIITSVWNGILGVGEGTKNLIGNQLKKSFMDFFPSLFKSEDIKKHLEEKDEREILKLAMKHKVSPDEAKKIRDEHALIKKDPKGYKLNKQKEALKKELEQNKDKATIEKLKKELKGLDSKPSISDTEKKPKIEDKSSKKITTQMEKLKAQIEKETDDGARNKLVDEWKSLHKQLHTEFPEQTKKAKEKIKETPKDIVKKDSNVSDNVNKNVEETLKDKKIKNKKTGKEILAITAYKDENHPMHQQVLKLLKKDKK